MDRQRITLWLALGVICLTLIQAPIKYFTNPSSAYAVEQIGRLIGNFAIVFVPGILLGTIGAFLPMGSKSRERRFNMYLNSLALILLLGLVLGMLAGLLKRL